MSLPRATLARPSPGRRLVEWLGARAAAPRAIRESDGFAAASHWCVSGAFAAGVAVGMYVLLVSGSLWHASLPLTVGWAIFAIFGVVGWFWPFLASYYSYTLFHRHGLLRSRLGGALFGATWHALAHAALIGSLGSDPVTMALSAPIAVGALWGSWLPAAMGRDDRLAALR